MNRDSSSPQQQWKLAEKDHREVRASAQMWFHCDELDPVLVHRAKMEEKDFVDKMGVYDIVPRSGAAKKGCRVIRTIWVTVKKG